MTHPYAIATTVALVALCVVLARQDSQPPVPPRHPHGPADMHHGPPPDMPEAASDGARHAEIAAAFADSVAQLSNEIARIATDRALGRGDRSQQARDSLEWRIRDLKIEMKDALRGQDRQTGRGHGSRGTVADLIDRVRRDPESIPLPAADSFVAGGLQIPAGSHHNGTAATVNGDLDVFGTVDGNAVAIGGDVVLHPGSHVTGSAFAAGGEVQMDGPGATVDGEIRSLQGPLGGPTAIAGTAVASAHGSRLHALKIAVAMFTLLMLLGLAVLTFAEDQLDHVTATLVDRFGRSAWYGIVGEVAALPVFLLLVIGLAITIIGVLALPFATIGYFVLLAGAATLGLVAVAEATGTAVLRTRGQAALSPRGAQLRAVVVGLSIYGGLWILTAFVGDGSPLGITIRGIAVAVTVVAMTVGFGAVILWRVELRRARRQTLGQPLAPGGPAGDQAVWVTPTPVAGVVAARRPTPPASSATGSST